MNPTEIKKVDVFELLELFTELWEKGVDYVDVQVDPKKNRISLSIHPEYMSKEAKPIDEDSSFSDLNIDDLI